MEICFEQMSFPGRGIRMRQILTAVWKSISSSCGLVLSIKFVSSECVKDPKYNTVTGFAINWFIFTYQIIQSSPYLFTSFILSINPHSFLLQSIVIIQLFYLLGFQFKFFQSTPILQRLAMWKTVNSVYKSANKNIKKIGKNLPSISTVSSTIQNIQINSLIPSISIKSNLPPQSQLQKTMNSIFSNKKPVMPVNKMSLIAEMSYDNQNFDKVCQLLLEKIKVFKYQAKYARNTLNTLVLLCYLIKNGPSGFVDEFRHQMNIFKEHSSLSLQNAYISDDKQIEKMKPLLAEIKQRAKYIMALLTDKKKLLKQKEISMEIKRKIMESSNKENDKMGNERQRNSLLFHGSFGNESGQKYSTGDKVDSFLQHYVWKYWNRFDQKMQNITEKIIQKIEEYLDLQEPESFSIQQLEVEEDDQPTKTQINLQKTVKIQQQSFLKKRNDLGLDIQEKEETGPVLNTDLV